MRRSFHHIASAMPEEHEKTLAAPRRTNSQLLPTLMDRLRDNAPHRKSEAPDEYAVTRLQMREIVQRDLAFLLNTTNMEGLMDRETYPEAASSTINFGVPPLAGSHLSEKKWADIEKLIRRGVTDFEPRLVPETLQVVPLIKNNNTNHYNVLLFEIRGQVRMDPYPLAFTVQSSVDLETNRMSVQLAR